jgi:hypothetical protein
MFAASCSLVDPGFEEYGWKPKISAVTPSFEEDLDVKISGKLFTVPGIE